MRMDFKQWSQQVSRKIDEQLHSLLKLWRSEVKKIDLKLLPLVDKFIAGCDGGKKIRGLLVCLGYQIGSNVILSETKDLSRTPIQSGRMRDTSNELRDSSLIVQNDIYKIAAAYEILHSAVLVHDDIIDQSPERRGQPSLYKAIGRGHYGISQALSLGDAGFFLAIKIISESSFPLEERTSALKLFSKVMLDTALGEMLDLEKANPLVVTKLKTAYYTISGPLQLGAVLGGPTSSGKAGLRGMKDFGENLGITFQIKDDLLDGETDFWGGVDKAKNKAEKYKIQAMKILPEITKDKKMSKILEQMGEYLVRRTK